MIHLTFMTNKPAICDCVFRLRLPGILRLGKSVQISDYVFFFPVFFPAAFSSMSDLAVHLNEERQHNTIKIMHSLLLVAELVWASVSATVSPTHSHSQLSLWCTVTPACLPRHSGKW